MQGEDSFVYAYNVACFFVKIPYLVGSLLLLHFLYLWECFKICVWSSKFIFINSAVSCSFENMSVCVCVGGQIVCVILFLNSTLVASLTLLFNYLTVINSYSNVEIMLEIADVLQKMSMIEGEVTILVLPFCVCVL